VLPQQTVVNFLSSSGNLKIVSLIPSVLSRATQLSTEQRAGITFACLVFGGLHWTSAVAMLTAIGDDDKNEAL